MSEIEKTLQQEIREKKRIGNSVHNKKGKRGYVGTMRTPADLLTGKEKRAYTQSSPVTTSNIYYDHIMSLDEFKALSRQKKMLVLDAYRRRFKTSEIASIWNCSQTNVYNYYKYYLKNAPAEEPQANPPAEAEQAKQATQLAADESLEKEAEQEKQCSFMLVGDYEAQSLSKKLNGLAFMLDDKRKYEIRLELKELQN